MQRVEKSNSVLRVLDEEKFEDTKGVIRIHKSKDRQYNGQQKNVKGTNSDLQNITHKIKDRVTNPKIGMGR